MPQIPSGSRLSLAWNGGCGWVRAGRCNCANAGPQGGAGISAGLVPASVGGSKTRLPGRHPSQSSRDCTATLMLQAMPRACGPRDRRSVAPLPALTSCVASSCRSEQQQQEQMRERLQRQAWEFIQRSDCYHPATSRLNCGIADWLRHSIRPCPSPVSRRAAERAGTPWRTGEWAHGLPPRSSFLSAADRIGRLDTPKQAKFLCGHGLGFHPRRRIAFAVTSTVAPVSARMAGHRPVIPTTVVTRNTALSPRAIMMF